MFEKKRSKLELLNDVNMLLLVERDVRGGMYHAIHWYARANNKYEKDFDPKKESSYLMYWDVNKLYGQIMQQKFPVDGFKWINYLSRFNEEFINNYYENKGKKYILKVDVKYPKELHDLPSDLPFLPEIIKIDKCETLHVTCMTRKTVS